ncbi:MAG: hypothetical protein D6729_14830, partial [Deltaproteobacteria bacterium]
TLGCSLTRPAELFEGSIGRPASGVFWYGFIWATVGGLFQWLWGLLLSGAEEAQIKQVLETLQQTNPEVADAMRQWMQLSHSGAGVLAVLWVPVGAALGILIWAALLHLSALVFGAAGGGWDATFKAVCYSQGPQVFNIVPQVGPLVALIWGVVIQIVGIQKLHGTTTGKAALVVLIWYLLCCLCICGGAFLAGMAVAGAAGAGGLQ